MSARDDLDDELHARAYVVGTDPEEWPVMTYLGSYPNGAGTLRQVQGIAFGGIPNGPNWFVTCNEPATLNRIPVERDLATFSMDDPGVLQRQWSPPDEFNDIANYDHFGALNFHENVLYVPMARYADDRRAILMRVDPATLQVTSYRNVRTSQGRSAAWCAVNPVDGFLYSSRHFPPDEDPQGIYINKYDATTLLAVGDPIELFDEAGGRVPFLGIQGGAFSTNGHLYLATSAPNALVMVDMVSRRRVASEAPPTITDEFEGVVIVDLDSVTAPCAPEGTSCRGGRLRGQVHVIDKVGTEAVTLYHWEIPAADRHKT